MVNERMLVMSGCSERVNVPAAAASTRRPAGLGGLGGYVTDHAGDAGVCLSMHQPWASLAVWGADERR